MLRAEVVLKEFPGLNHVGADRPDEHRFQSGQ